MTTKSNSPAAAVDVAQFRVGQRPQASAVEIDKAQPSPPRDKIRRQGIVAEGAAAEMRRQAADIGQRVDLDPQQFQAGIAGYDLKWNARQAQEAGRVRRGDEPIDKGGFDLVEIGFRRNRARGAVRLVRRLPLHRGALAMRMIVPGPVRRMRVIMMMIMDVTMIMCMTVIVVTMAVT